MTAFGVLRGTWDNNDSGEPHWTRYAKSPTFAALFERIITLLSFIYITALCRLHIMLAIASV